MKKLLTYFFCTLGVIFFMLMGAGAYLWFADPFEIRPIISILFEVSEPTSATAVPEAGSSIQQSETNLPTDTAVVDKHPALSPTQETALETIGIDPAALPSTITPAQEACFVDKLGAARVAEIKEGDTPSPTEFFTARACIE